MQPALSTDTSAPDVESYLRIHRCLRASAAQLAARLAPATARPATRRADRALARWYRGFADEIRGHHQVEDVLLFPALATRIATYGEHSARLQGDHAEVDQLLDGLGHALRDGDRPRAQLLAETLHHHLDEHLDYEDDEIVPLFVRHFSGAEFEILNNEAVRMTPPRQLVFTAPWLLAQLDRTEQQRVIASVPKALHVLWICTRGRYDRLVTRAFSSQSTGA